MYYQSLIFSRTLFIVENMEILQAFLLHQSFQVLREIFAGHLLASLVLSFVVKVTVNKSLSLAKRRGFHGDLIANGRSFVFLLEFELDMS